MKSAIIGMVSLSLLLSLLGQSQAQPLKLSQDARAVATGNNVFALDLYARLGQEKGNLFFSPYSISSALGMTYAGARGQTAEQMASTLHFGLPPDKLHDAFGDLVKHLNAKNARRPFQLNVANALWGQKGFNFLPDFLKLAENNYNAKLSELDFINATEQARQIINQWVEKETQEKIKDLIPKGALNVDTRMVLTNAIYFKSAWVNNFAKGSTKPEDFTLSAGNKVKAPMMRKSEKLQYMSADNFHAVSIPYDGYALSMIVLLPKKGGNLAEVEKQLTSANLDQWVKKMKQHQVDLKLPKFKMTKQFNLSKTLAEMGMPLAFAPGGADFSGMSTQAKLFIQQVLHKAFVDVHEEGTEAAAATAVIVGVTSLPPPLPPATFHADQPFTFLIRENQTGSILFMGRVENPAE